VGDNTVSNKLLAVIDVVISLWSKEFCVY
jgi:hypothetical protein